MDLAGLNTGVNIDLVVDTVMYVHDSIYSLSNKRTDVPKNLATAEGFRSWETTVSTVQSFVNTICTALASV